jgi:hypothetical protein
MPELSLARLLNSAAQPDRMTKPFSSPKFEMTRYQPGLAKGIHLVGRDRQINVNAGSAAHGADSADSVPFAI